MSDVENALTGAEAAPAPEENVQDTPQAPAPVETDEQQEERARNEKGQFIQKRINELTREKHEARREADRIRQENEQLRQEVSRYRQPAAPDPETDFAGHVAHIAEQRAREVLEQERSQWQQQQEHARFQTIAEQYAEKEQAYAVNHPDYSEAVDAFVQIIGNDPLLAEVLMTSDHGPQVAHYLGTHLDEAAKVASLPPHMRVAHVARLEARLSAPKPKPVTAAPAPAPTVGGVSAASKAPERMSTEEWMAWRNSQR